MKINFPFFLDLFIRVMALRLSLRHVGVHCGVFFFLVRSIKHYFLMDKGDFFVHFMDLTEEELKKPVDDIVPPRLEALLELALRMSTANTDPFKDDLKVGGATVLSVFTGWSFCVSSPLCSDRLDAS